ncbi:hypothetical protein SAMN05192561_1179 [Halopenitus malekzadehii]|uniref:Uncharacterized protein n=1 Tax=Halopenitus malekzadehii TaxID=1267564 RepID=A0A1H6JRU4_9EURY|nr:hypothetical protein [Halopenitus malekzadehii]SEH63637.1 hypothetical protein SAMN05192561_1179 [Halopenitus malekzadehii]
MPAKTGGSHAVSAFVTLIVGTMFSKYLWSVAPPLGEAGVLAMAAIRSTTGIAVPATDQFAGSVVIMLGLSFVWGIVYHVSRHG